MNIYSLASGSKGNATVVAAEDDWLLIDDGLPYKTLVERLADVAPLGFTGDFSRLLGVLVTHSHSDHVSGIKSFLKKHPELPIYANAMTAETVVEETGVAEGAFVCFENGQPFEVGPFEVSAFSIPHDTSDPVGFLVKAGGETYFHGTDIGTPLDSIGLKLAEADVATLESNHDAVMLRKSGRPPSLIQRIAGPRGHLSNDDACELVRRHLPKKLKRLGLAHLSQDCNEPHLAEGLMRRTLAELKRTDIDLRVYAQDHVVSFA